MSPLVVTGADVARADLDAAELLAQNQMDRLDIVRTRAEKWVGAITAFASLVGIALVLEAPATGDIEMSFLAMAVTLLGLAFVALVFATFRAYQAAYGDPDRIAEISTQPLTGLGARLDTARLAVAQEAQRHLAQGIAAAVWGVSVLALGIVVAWLAPEPSEPPAKNTCLVANGTVVAELSSTEAVKLTAAGTQLRPCA